MRQKHEDVIPPASKHLSLPSTSNWLLGFELYWETRYSCLHLVSSCFPKHDNSLKHGQAWPWYSFNLRTIISCLRSSKHIRRYLSNKSKIKGKVDFVNNEKQNISYFFLLVFNQRNMMNSSNVTISPRLLWYDSTA